MADNDDKGPKVLDKEPEYTRAKGETAEAFMARVAFGKASVFKTGKGKHINMDGNGDGILTPAEAKAGFDLKEMKEDAQNNPAKAAAHKYMLELAEQTRKEGKNITDVTAYEKELSQTLVIKGPKGEKLEAIKGNISEKDLKKLDENGDGKVSIGEFRYYQFEQQKNLPKKPQNNGKGPVA